MGKPRKRKFKKVVVLIPLVYNDDRQVPETVRDDILDEIYAAFHGWTIESEREMGAYRMLSGEKRVEPHMKIAIVVPEDGVDTIRQMAKRWARRSDQENIQLEITDSVIEFVSPNGQGE